MSLKLKKHWIHHVSAEKNVETDAFAAKALPFAGG